MSEAQSIKIFATASSDVKTHGQFATRKLTSGARLQRALMFVAGFWLMSCFCILIPIFHFILVPGFILTGIITGIRAFSAEIMITGGEIECPHCHQTVKIRSGPARWPVKEVCGSCGSWVKLEPEA